MKILTNTIMTMAPLLIKATRSQGLHEPALKYWKSLKIPSQFNQIAGNHRADGENMMILLRLRWIWSSWQSWRWEPVDLDADDDDDDYIHDETYFSMRLRWNIENHSKFLPSSTKLQATTALHRTTIRKLPQNVQVEKWELTNENWKVNIEKWKL